MTDYPRHTFDEALELVDKVTREAGIDPRLFTPRTWIAHAEADHAVLEQVAWLVDEFRANQANLDLEGDQEGIWAAAADRIADVLAQACDDIANGEHTSG